jgi:hypothetical protein
VMLTVAAAVLSVLATPAAASPSKRESSAPEIMPLRYYFFLSATINGLCLDNDADTQQNVRTNVQLYTCHYDMSNPSSGYMWQRWRFTSVPNRPSGEWRIQNENGKCLSYSPNSIGMAPVWTEACGRSGQGWRIINPQQSVDNLWVYLFESIDSPGLCLDSQTINGEFRGGIDLFPCSSTGRYVRWAL